MHRIRYLIVALALAFLAYLTIPAPAFADATAPGPDLGQVRVPAIIVSLFISTLIPLATGLLTKAHWPARAKDTVTVALNAINVLIVGAVLPGGAAVFSLDTLLVWLLTTVTSIAAYFRAWKPAGITSTPTPDGSGEIPGRLAGIGVK